MDKYEFKFKHFDEHHILLTGISLDKAYLEYLKALEKEKRNDN
jgi:vacuolar-type H+-ATPase subunit C/Vma6